MIKRQWTLTCDLCGKVAVGTTNATELESHLIRRGWQGAGTFHSCPSCSRAYEQGKLSGQLESRKTT